MYSRIFSVRTIVEVTVGGLLLFGMTTVDNDAIAGGYKDKSKQGDIIEVATEAGTFNTLAAALDAAGLVETLKGDGPFTVFAPTDEAFAKLPSGTVESLLLPENQEKLVAILTYHVVAGKVTSGQVVKLDSAQTVNGQEVSIRTNNGAVMIDNATVSAVDIMASNGVIHVIDEVILPN
jgi:uncharacterized surface protein with fasciclin (FAS1) repeats